jgi:magnesium/cobalt transport protein CorA
MDQVEAYIYDATGSDQQIELSEVDIESLDEKQLLWVNVLTRERDNFCAVIGRLKLNNVPIDSVLADTARPTLAAFEDFLWFSVDAVATRQGASPERVKIDYIVGKNFVITIHEGRVEYFEDFRDREKGETRLGELDAESFVAKLLDLNVVSYFTALDELERRVDRMDERVLKREIEPERFLSDMVSLRRDASRLRKWLMPHRDVFYSLSRADFQQIADSDSQEHFQMLNQHFESAVEAIENSRDTVLGLFELYATKSAQTMNLFVQRLTFLTLLTGTLAVIAGILGMNYKASIFEAENGFWLTVALMALVAGILTAFARFKRWI